MGKDSVSNPLYMLGIIGSIMVMIALVYLIVTGIVFHGTPDVPFDRVLMAAGAVFTSLALLGIYRDFETYIPIIPFLAFNLYQVVGIALSPFLHLGYFTPAYLVIWLLMFIGFGLSGYSFHLTREQIGEFAKIAAIIFIIWAFVRIPVAYMIAETESLIYYQTRSVGELITSAAGLIYYILAFRSGKLATSM